MLPDIEEGAFGFVGGGDELERVLDAGEKGGERPGVGEDEAEGGMAVECVGEVEVD